MLEAVISDFDFRVWLWGVRLIFMHVYKSAPYRVVSGIAEVRNRVSQGFLGQCFRSVCSMMQSILLSCPCALCCRLEGVFLPLLVWWHQAALVYGQMNEPPGARARVLRRDGLRCLRSRDTCLDSRLRCSFVCLHKIYILVARRSPPQDVLG